MLSFPRYLIYPLYTGALVLLTIILVPRREIRALFFWGMLYGGFIDFILIIMVGLLGVGGYLNYGPFSLSGMPFFPLLAWAFYFILYLYILPPKKPYNYIFTILAAGYSTIFSNVLMNVGIFQWNNSKVIIPSLLYLFWNSLVTWSFQKYFIQKPNTVD